MKSLWLTIVLFGTAGPLCAGELDAQAYGLLKSIYSYDLSFPLNVRVAGSVSRDGHTFEKIVYNSFHDGNVTGLIAVPSKGEGPFPVVLLLHGVTGNKSQWLGDEFTHGGELSAALLRAGYAVLALDAQYHGDRAVYNDYIDAGDMVFRRGWGVRYANMLTQSVVDYRRAIDYLESRADIDAARIGLVGYSMGGHMAFILGAVEQRIKAVACVVPHMAGMPMAASAFARDLGDDPLLMLMGRDDKFYTTEQAQMLFDAVPGSSKTIEFFDSGHSLPAGYTARASQWLKTNL